MEVMVQNTTKTTFSNKQEPQGFSLIELSVVLIIISLIAGAVVGGRTLVESARVRTIMTEYQQFDQAFTTFYDTYDAYAGDMPNASEFWPGEAENGQGDFTYNDEVSDGYRAWQHLALAELIEGNYCGRDCGPNGLDMDLDIDAPTAQYNRQAGWLASDQNVAGITEGIKYVRLGSPTTNSNQGEAVIARHARLVDLKLDDGIYNDGKVRGSEAFILDGLCFTGGEYNLEETQLGCAMLFELSVQ